MSPAAQEQAKATLEDVRRIIGAGAKPVGSVLPDAIAEATEQRGTALAVALEPSVSRAIRTVASREPECFSDILAPTIGASVRKAVSAEFAALMQRFNEALDRSLSLRWRLEAHRTGRPFAEVVLLHTLVYRVEQVFLIHAESGLVLEHVASVGVPSADPDHVSSMLSAMEVFGHEAFEPGATQAYLHEFALGDHRVWIDRGPRIAVAIVVRGVAPRSLLELVTETRERISLNYQAELAQFLGDVTPFAGTRPLLEACAREQRKEAPRRGPVVLAVLAAVAAVLLLAFPVRGYLHGREEDQRLSSVRNMLDAEPGIVVTAADRVGDRYRLRGFRDPVATDPALVVARAGNPRVELLFEPFYSLESALIEARFRRLARPPAGVKIAVAGSTLRLSGPAPKPWIDRALPLAATLPGVERVDSALSDTSAAELDAAARALEALAVPFERGSSELAAEAAPVVERASELIERVQRVSVELGRESCVVVIGDADPSGPAQGNARLARARASAVLAAVQGASSRLAKESLRARARAATEQGGQARRVFFQVEVASGTGGAACGEGDER